MKTTYKVRISRSAKLDLDEIISFYSQERIDYAKNVMLMIKKSIQSLKTFPEKGRIVPELSDHNIHEYREILSSYWRILYKIENSDVFVHAIIDGRRNTEELLMRKLSRR